MNQEIRHPSEQTTFEFLDEHLYQFALKGGYNREMEQVKPYLVGLAKYQSAGEFMKAARKNRKLRKELIRRLKQFWQSNYDLRPATGALLMLAMQVNAPAASDEYWYELFVELGKGGEL